jgi:hypothetical protein
VGSPVIAGSMMCPQSQPVSASSRS